MYYDKEYEKWNFMVRYVYYLQENEVTQNMLLRVNKTNRK